MLRTSYRTRLVRILRRLEDVKGLVFADHAFDEQGNGDELHARIIAKIDREDEKQLRFHMQAAAACNW